MFLSWTVVSSPGPSCFGEGQGLILSGLRRAPIVPLFSCLRQYVSDPPNRTVFNRRQVFPPPSRRFPSCFLRTQDTMESAAALLWNLDRRTFSLDERPKNEMTAVNTSKSGPVPLFSCGFCFSPFSGLGNKPADQVLKLVLCSGVPTHPFGPIECTPHQNPPSFILMAYVDHEFFFQPVSSLPPRNPPLSPIMCAFPTLRVSVRTLTPWASDSSVCDIDWVALELTLQEFFQGFLLYFLLSFFFCEF